MTGVVIQGHMQRHQVGSANQVVDTASPLGQGRQLPGALDRQLGIEPNYVHAQIHRCIGDTHADGAQTQHGEGLSGQFKAGELLLALFNL